MRDESAPQPNSSGLAWRIRLLFGIALGLTGIGVFALGSLALASELPERRLAIWGLSGEAWFLVSLVVGLVALAVALMMLPGLWRWFATLPAASALIVLMIGGLVAPPQLTPLEVDGCVSPYRVAEQRDGSLDVYVLRGNFAEEVLDLSVKNAWGAFTNGRYRTEVHGTQLDVWYESASPRWPQSMDGDPAFSLSSEVLDCSR